MKKIPAVILVMLMVLSGSFGAADEFDDVANAAARSKASAKFSNLFSHISNELDSYPCWALSANGEYVAGKDFKSGWVRLLYIGEGDASVTLSRKMVNSPGGMAFFADDVLSFGAKAPVPFAAFSWYQADNSCFSVYDFPIPKGTVLSFESSISGENEILYVQFIESL